MRLLPAALILIACGPPVPATLGEVEREVFAKSCAFSSCHVGSSPAGSLKLEGRSFAGLVNVKAAAAPGQLRVVPGKPESSFLITRLIGSGGLGLMPPDQPLDPERLELVRSWIAAGAKDD